MRVCERESDTAMRWRPHSTKFINKLNWAGGDVGVDVAIAGSQRQPGCVWTLVENLFAVRLCASVRLALCVCVTPVVWVGGTKSGFKRDERHSGTKLVFKEMNQFISTTQLIKYNRANILLYRKGLNLIVSVLTIMSIIIDKIFYIYIHM